MNQDAVSLVRHGPEGIDRPPSTPEAEAAAVTLLARQFEATLLRQMLSTMNDSLLGDEESKGLGMSVMADQMHMELALSLSKAGGVGLAESLVQSLRSVGVDVPSVGAISPQSLSDAVQSASPIALTGVHESTLPADAQQLHEHTDVAVGSVLPAARHISAAFGWRRDPFTQHTRFHQGTDLRAAYGRDVRAAGDGVVTYAGDRGGYGLTVVVDHGDGVETCYAHLSAADVKAGTRVRAGEVLARSGNSGRSTGAHLHFEVRRDGKAVDPREFDGRFVPVVDLE
jgi:murein DD-endopeptidase MepM/ murein hydrolase activator NlpD